MYPSNPRRGPEMAETPSGASAEREREYETGVIPSRMTNPGEPCAVKVASTVRRGVSGNQPRSQAPGTYPTTIVRSGGGLRTNGLIALKPALGVLVIERRVD